MTKNTKTTNNDKESKLAHLVGPTDPQVDAQARDRLSLPVLHSYSDIHSLAILLLV